MKRLMSFGMIAGLLVIVSLLTLGCSDLLGPTSGTPRHASPQPQFLTRSHSLAKTAGEDVLYGEEWMDEEGGEIKLESDVAGSNEIEVEEGALTQETLISMSVPLSGELVSTIADVTFGPHGTQFLVPAKVTLSYQNADLTGIDENEIHAYYWNEEAGVWEDLGGTVDTEKQQVIFNIDHFSRYALGRSL